MTSVLDGLDLQTFTEQLNQARRASSNGHGLETKEKREPRFTKWQPRKWDLVYSEIVLLSSAGWSNKDLAQRYNYTEVHISNILHTPQADLLRRKVLDKLHEKSLETLPTKLEHIANKTVDRLKQLVDDDEKFQESPFGVIDRGMKVLSGLGHIKGEDSGARRGNISVDKAIILNAKDSSDLLDGLKKAEKAKELHSGPPNGIKIELKSKDFETLSQEDSQFFFDQGALDQANQDKIEIKEQENASK